MCLAKRYFWDPPLPSRVSVFLDFVFCILVYCIPASRRLLPDVSVPLPDPVDLPILYFNYKRIQPHPDFPTVTVTRLEHHRKSLMGSEEGDCRTQTREY